MRIFPFTQLRQKHTAGVTGQQRILTPPWQLTLPLVVWEVRVCSGLLRIFSLDFWFRPLFVVTTCHAVKHQGFISLMNKKGHFNIWSPSYVYEVHKGHMHLGVFLLEPWCSSMLEFHVYTLLVLADRQSKSSMQSLLICISIYPKL